MRTAFIQTLEELAAKDKRIFLVVGDLGYSVIENFQKRFPKQFLNAGVSEQNMTGMAAGLAMSGKTVFTYSIANFPTMRALEQVRDDICYHQANVKIISVGEGLHYGGLGYTHHAVEDFAVMRSLPGMRVFAPADPAEAAFLTRSMAAMEGPCYMRVGKGPVLHKKIPKLQVGKAALLRAGKDVAFFSSGAITGEVMEAASLLQGKNVDAAVWSMHTVKPLDEEAVQKASKAKLLVTVEEHVPEGGLGEAVAATLVKHGISTPLLRVCIKNPLDSPVGDRDYLWKFHGLDRNSITKAVIKTLQS